MNARDDDRNRADWGADPDLLDVLRGADPARSLPPILPAELTRLVEATLEADAADHDADGSGTRRPGLASWVAVAAVVLVAGVVGLGLGLTRTGSDTPVAQAPVETDVTVLRVPESTSGRCAVPTPEMLAQQEVAFEGVVTDVAGDSATLEPTTVYAGRVGSRVQVVAPSVQMGELLNAVQFRPGRTYLVSATGGQVTLCGSSAEATSALRSLYEQAFAG